MKYLARLVCWISLVALACLWFTDRTPPEVRGFGNGCRRPTDRGLAPAVLRDHHLGRFGGLSGLLDGGRGVVAAECSGARGSRPAWSSTGRCSSDTNPSRR